MKAVDLFAGCGGLSLGLTQAGVEVLAGVDNWDKSLAVYRANFSHEGIQLDLSDVPSCVKLLSTFDCDLVAGGPPCQDFSSAGKRDLAGGRADLTYRFAEVISNFAPKYFIMENVERIRKSHILLDVVKDLAASGYGMTACVLDASYCGAPQARERFFLIGSRGVSHNFLLEHLKNNLSPSPMTMRDYFGNELGIDHYYRHPRNYNRRAVYSLDEPSATIRGVNRPIPKGYNKHDGDPVEITEKVRPLTTKERSLIQTFPEDFIFNGTKTDLEQIIGNAVPVKLAEFVANCINEYIKDKQENKQISIGQLELVYSE